MRSLFRSVSFSLKLLKKVEFSDPLTEENSSTMTQIEDYKNEILVIFGHKEEEEELEEETNLDVINEEDLDKSRNQKRNISDTKGKEDQI